MAGNNGDIVGFEEGLSWLPSHLLHEAYGGLKPDEQLRSRKKYQNRPRNGVNRASGGPGMRAVFLEAGRKTNGTGVFLPQRAGTHLRPTNKPACSPVLLPYRVVQALNLNVQASGLHISPHEEQKMNQKGRVDHRSGYKNEGNDFRDHCCVISEDQTCSPEAFLPKEWSY